MPPISLPLLDTSDAAAKDLPLAPEAHRAVQANGLAPASAVHAKVLSVVASRICQGNGEGIEDGGAEAEATCLDLLCRAVIASPEAFKQALVRLRRLQGISDEEIVDSYIPAVAWRLGVDWMESRTSFVDVTIGTARLISAVREITADWRADEATGFQTPAMVLIVPESEQHRLGALIAASRFRRQGVSVRLLIGCSSAEIASVACNGGYDMVGFSVATRSGLEATRRLIHMLRTAGLGAVPILVGGAVASPADDVRALTGADHVVADPEEAVRLCVTNISERSRPERAMAGF
jgi:methylmalonyl-CoA mutase cobalamin-binding subunit